MIALVCLAGFALIMFCLGWCQGYENRRRWERAVRRILEDDDPLTLFRTACDSSHVHLVDTEEVEVCEVPGLSRQRSRIVGGRWN